MNSNQKVTKKGRKKDVKNPQTVGRKFESTFCNKNDYGVLGGSAGHLLEKPLYISTYHKGRTKKEKRGGCAGEVKRKNQKKGGRGEKKKKKTRKNTKMIRGKRREKGKSKRRQATKMRNNRKSVK